MELDKLKQELALRGLTNDYEVVLSRLAPKARERWFNEIVKLHEEEKQNEYIRIGKKVYRVKHIYCDVDEMDMFEPCHPNYATEAWIRRIPLGKGRTYADEEGTVIKGREWSL